MRTEGQTLDRFLGGRVVAAHRRIGFRAGHDSVLLAAGVPGGRRFARARARLGRRHREPLSRRTRAGPSIIGIEIDPELVHLAIENAARNGVHRSRFVCARDATDDCILFLPRRGRCRAATEGTLDHVFFNPPFHPDTGHSRRSLRVTLRHAICHDAVREWTGRALSLVRDGGTVTAIIRADRVKTFWMSRAPTAESYSRCCRA